MRSGHDNGAASADEALVDIAFVQRHVGAVGAIKNHRRDALAFHGKQHKRRQPLLIDVNPVDGDAFANQLFANEAAHLFGAHACDQGRPESQPRRSDRDVGRAAAHRFGETPNVLESASDLLPIEIDGRAANTDHIEGLLERGAFGHLPPQNIASPSTRRSLATTLTQPARKLDARLTAKGGMAGLHLAVPRGLRSIDDLDFSALREWLYLCVGREHRSEAIPTRRDHRTTGGVSMNAALGFAQAPEVLATAIACTVPLCPAPSRPNLSPIGAVSSTCQTPSTRRRRHPGAAKRHF